MTAHRITDLPEAHADPIWRDGTEACTKADPEAFYPEPGQSTVLAKALCNRCPKRTTCLEWSLATKQKYGIWGAKTPNERSRMLTKLKAKAGRNQR